MEKEEEGGGVSDFDLARAVAVSAGSFAPRHRLGDAPFPPEGATAAATSSTGVSGDLAVRRIPTRTAWSPDDCFGSPHGRL